MALTAMGCYIAPSTSVIVFTGQAAAASSSTYNSDLTTGHVTDSTSILLAVTYQAVP
jgi:hypothetical protein